MPTRRDFVRTSTAGLFTGGTSGVLGTTAAAAAQGGEPIPPPSLPSDNPMGVVVSTQPGRGDFKSDGEAVQAAYDAMMTTLGMPKTLVLDSTSARPFKMDRPLDVWQSRCRVTGTGGLTLEPADCFELAFVGTQMLAWREDGAVMELGEKNARWPTGIVMISHCLFGSTPGSDTVGIRLVNVEESAPCLAAFGNSFGSNDRRLGHAVDWGPQKNKLAAWGANAVHVKGEPHIGELPEDADVSPFRS